MIWQCRPNINLQAQSANCMLLSLTRRYITRASPTLHSTIRTMAILKQVVAKESDLKDGEL